MSPQDLENTLRNLSQRGQLVKDRGYRQIWRFEAGGKGYYLKFFPRPGGKLKRMIRGNPAMREFTRMQLLQKNKVPSPRAVAVLAGFMLDGVKGDAVISDAIEPSVTLDQYFNDFEQRGQSAPDRREIALQLAKLVKQLGDSALGHDDLHLGNILRGQDGRLYLLDAYAVTRGGLKMKQILRLGHSVMRYASRQDLLRGWRILAGDAPLPRFNTVSPGIWKQFTDKIWGDNRYFGRIESNGWSGVYFGNWKYPYRFSAASRLTITRDDWEREWPLLLQRIEGGLLESLKSSASGDVYAAEITLAGRPLEVIIKRPRRKAWFRHVRELGRGGRARRAWKKAWHLITRNIPAAWPLLLMERRILGYAVEQVLVCERVPGKPLATTNLDLLEPDGRDRMFRRCGNILRKIELAGYCHFDSKSSNWIILPDDSRGPTPVLVDVDGVRFYRWDTFGIRRLLKSLREHHQYTPEDSLALCQGYAPFTRFDPEEVEQ